MTESDDWHHARNILCVRLDALGDVLMTTPALRALWKSRPERRLTFLTSPAGAAVAPLVPVLDEVIVYDAPWMKATAPRADSRPDHAMIQRLRAGRFDAAVIFTVYSQNPLPAALLCYLADIPLRLAHCRENPYQVLTHWVRDPEPEQVVRHEVRRQLDLVGTIGCRTADERMLLRVPAEAVRRVQVLLREEGIERTRPWVVLHPGASAPSRRYPAEGFAAAARELVAGDGWQVLFTGSEEERPLVEQVRGLMGVESKTLAGRLDLPALAALLAVAPMLIANNTGPVHIAAALGTPVVDLYALTNPQHTPWETPQRVLSHDVPCKNCYRSICPEGHHDCLRRVPPEAVAQAARELLHECNVEPRRERPRLEASRERERPESLPSGRSRSRLARRSRVESCCQPFGEPQCTRWASTPPSTIPPPAWSTTDRSLRPRRRSASRTSSTASAPFPSPPTNCRSTPSTTVCARPASTSWT